MQNEALSRWAEYSLWCIMSAGEDRCVFTHKNIQEIEKKKTRKIFKYRHGFFFGWGS